MGTLVSGALYSYVDPQFATNGIGACFMAGAVSSLLAAVLTYPIRDDVGGAWCVFVWFVCAVCVVREVCTCGEGGVLCCCGVWCGKAMTERNPHQHGCV